MVDNLYVRNVEFIKSATRVDQSPLLGLPEVAVAGRSNVGKSSLINRLVNRKRIARVSNTPGRTQLLNFFLVNKAFSICDLPGYGYARVPIAIKRSWGPMVERYLEQRDDLRAILILMDIRRRPGDWEQELMTWSSLYGRGVIPVVTKVDKLSRSRRGPALAQIAKALGCSPRKLIAWSAPTGEGLMPLWEAIQRAVSGDSGSSSSSSPNS